MLVVNDLVSLFGWTESEVESDENSGAYQIGDFISDAGIAERDVDLEDLIQASDSAAEGEGREAGLSLLTDEMPVRKVLHHQGGQYSVFDSV